ncbi:MAG: hypothetical protein ACREQ5_24445, partial [Candidatus Dormibacteria bacterium]
AEGRPVWIPAYPPQRHPRRRHDANAAGWVSARTPARAAIPGPTSALHQGGDMTRINPIDRGDGRASCLSRRGRRRLSLPSAEASRR